MFSLARLQWIFVLLFPLEILMLTVELRRGFVYTISRDDLGILLLHDNTEL